MTFFHLNCLTLVLTTIVNHILLPTLVLCSQWRSQPDIWSCKCKFFCVYRLYKESISKEMNNDNDLNLHLHDQMSGWLRYCMFDEQLLWTNELNNWWQILYSLDRPYQDHVMRCENASTIYQTCPKTERLSLFVPLSDINPVGRSNNKFNHAKWWKMPEHQWRIVKRLHELSGIENLHLENLYLWLSNIVLWIWNLQQWPVWSTNSY